MARVSTSAACAANSGFQITATFDAWETGTSVGGNYSTVSWHLVVARTNSGGTFTGSTRNHAGWVKCGINGQQVYGGYTGMPHGMTNGTVLVDKSGSVNVGHNDDGTKTVDFYVDLDQSDDDYGHINYYFSDGPISSGKLGLTNIARASQPSINTHPNNSPDITAGTTCVIYMNSASSSFRHSATWSFGSLSGQTGGFEVASGIKTSIYWNPPTSMMNQIPNATSGTGTVSVTTYNGSTAIGTRTVSFTLHQPSDAAPGKSVSYAEAGTLTDGKTTLSSKGIGATTVVGQVSVKKITISASAKYGSSITQIACTHNGWTQVSSSASTTFTFNAPVNTGGNKSYFSWTVKDSRGNTSQDGIAMDFIPYQKPVVGVLNPVRSSATASTGTVSINGSFYNGSVGNISNGISASITYNGTTVSPALTKSGNTFSGSSNISGVNPSGNYSFTATVTDSLGFSNSKTITLSKANPTLWVGKDTVRINSYEIINRTLVRTAYHIYGSTDTSLLACLGNWTGNWDTCILHLQYFGGNGYNGRPDQNTVVDIFAKNGWQATQSSYDAFGVTYEIRGNAAGLHKVSAYATSHDSLNLYMQLAPYHDGYITVEYTGGKWTPYAIDGNVPAATVTGTGQRCELYIPGHPVGSIYQSLDSTSPETLFGGTWEEITGRFLLAHDGSHPAASTGGEFSHTLTANEIPSHNHAAHFYMSKVEVPNVNYGLTGDGGFGGRVLVYNNGGGRSYDYNYAEGGGQAHNNTPPYLSVYMWKRTG